LDLDKPASEPRDRSARDSRKRHSGTQYFETAVDDGEVDVQRIRQGNFDTSRKHEGLLILNMSEAVLLKFGLADRTNGIRTY
jgi:hypothetical protein